MTRRLITTRCVALLAFLGVLALSTATVWAMPCADDCAMMDAGHGCCAPQVHPPGDTRMTTTTCCGGSVELVGFGPGTHEVLAGASGGGRVRALAHAQALTVVLVSALTVRPSRHREHPPNAPPTAAPLGLRTTVLLL